MIIALKHLIKELIQRFLVSILAWPDFHLIKELIQCFLVLHPTRPDLPDEILAEIFSRLPTKSIGKCRCLSKKWRSSLSTRHFIKSHLARQNQEKLILITPDLSIRCVETIRADCDDTASREIKLPGLWDEVLGSCDGLLLLMNTDDDDDDENKVILANPVTRELVKIPNVPFPPMGLRIIYGFGHDSVHDDYKVVAVCYYYYRPRSGSTVEENVAMEVFVYSVKSGVWISVEYPRYCYRWPVTPSGAFVNGAFHWSTVGESNCRVIAALDLANEVLFEIPAPSGVDVEYLLSRAPVVLGGCLCVMKGTDVWVMKEYGVAESWTKFSVNGFHFGQWFKPLCFMEGREEEVVLLVEGPCLVVCNVKDGMLRDLVVDGGIVDGCTFEERLLSYVDGCTFVESLLSPAPLCRPRY